MASTHQVRALNSSKTEAQDAAANRAASSASGDGRRALAAPDDDNAVAVGRRQQLAVKAPGHVHDRGDVALQAETA